MAHTPRASPPEPRSERIQRYHPLGNDKLRTNQTRPRRLNQAEQHLIKNAVLAVDPEARIYLYGSRVDDSKKGGDIDLLVLSRSLTFQEKLRLRAKLSECLGDQKVDLTVATDTHKPFMRLALNEGIEL